MKTTIVLEVIHDKPIPHLADLIAGRAYTIDKVSDCLVVTPSAIEAPEPDLAVA
jgi:hypothetical protein